MATPAEILRGSVSPAGGMGTPGFAPSPRTQQEIDILRQQQMFQAQQMAQQQGAGKGWSGRGLLGAPVAAALNMFGKKGREERLQEATQANFAALQRQEELNQLQAQRQMQDAYQAQLFQKSLEGPERLSSSEVINGQVVTIGPDGRPVAAPVEGFQAAQEPVNFQRVSAIVAGEQTPTSLNFNPRTGEYIRQMPDGSVQAIASSQVMPVSVQGGMSDVLPPTRQDIVAERRDWLQFQNDEIGTMIGLLEADPSLVGLPGAARRVGQTISGTINDVGAMFGEQGAATAQEFINTGIQNAASMVESGALSEDQFNKMFNDPALSEIRLFENTLGLTLASLRSPDQRIPVSVIERSMQDAKLTGFTSSTDVVNRLKSIQRQIDSRLESMNKRLGEETPQRSSPRAFQQTLGAPQVPEGVDPALWEVMTPEERSLWQN